jgi:putative transposase
MRWASRRSQAGSIRGHAFFRKLQRPSRVRPQRDCNDKLRSYAATKRIVMPGFAHRQQRYLNNRAENFHQPTRERERRMRRFKS